MGRIYLDNNATTPVRPEVAEALARMLKGCYGNPSTLYCIGQEAHVEMEHARDVMAEILGCDREEVIFTSGGTESDNLAVFGVARALKKKGNHIITTKIEHHAVLNPCKALEKEGWSVTYLPVDSYGMVDPADVERAITDGTVLISVMHANNEVGTIQPIAEIGKLAKARKITFHTDAVQSFGKLSVNVNELGVDLLSASSHKIYGPKGVGLLYIRKGTKIMPIMYGGHQERSLRPGTENVPGVVGFGRAAELMARGRRGRGRAPYEDARPALGGDTGQGAACDTERAPDQEAGGDAERDIRIRGRRIHNLEPGRIRHLRRVRLCVHLRRAGAFARPVGHGGPGGEDPRGASDVVWP